MRRRLAQLLPPLDGELLLAPVKLHAGQQTVPVDRVAVEFRAIDADELARLELARTAVAAGWPRRNLERWSEEFSAYLLLQEAEALFAQPPAK